jgi:hypothetical protein
VAVRLQKQATLLNIGVELLEESLEACPFCGQLLNDELRTGISERHASVKTEIEKGATREQSRSRVVQVLADVKKSIKEHTKLSERRTENLIGSMQAENASKVCELLGGKSVASAAVVRAAAETANGLIQRLLAASAHITDAVLNCEVHEMQQFIKPQ